MGDIFDLGEARRDKFLNMSGKEKLHYYHVEALANGMLLREGYVAQGFSEEEASAMSGRLFSEYSSLSEAEQQEVKRRMEDIKAREAEQDRLLREHIDETGGIQ